MSLEIDSQNETRSPALPKAFVWKRIHSFTGFWLVLFLIEHLLSNSQAALWIGDNGSGFVHAANFLSSLPYLQVIELTLIGIPLLIHGIWGIQYALTSKQNIIASDGSKPSLGQYPRNRAFTWQRATSWILLIGIIAHVVQMRFLDYPLAVDKDQTRYQIVKIGMDPGLYTLSARLGVELIDKKQIQQLAQTQSKNIPSSFSWNPLLTHQNVKYDPSQETSLTKQQNEIQEHNWITALQKKPLREDEVLAITPEYGKAVLLSVRDTFKSPLMGILYTILVLAATYHGFNGLWTFLITWGVSLSAHSQYLTRVFCYALMGIVTFLGLAAIWGTFWINLTY